jgi:lipid-A-disaccharide synthase
MKLFFSVGEPSGDLHGANLIRQLRQQAPDIECVGYGGPKMAAAGCELHEDLTQLSVMWFLRALTNLDKFWGLAGRADRYFRHHKPNAVVMIDYPGFNWWIAWRAKVHGIPVFYYGTPQIWAWGQWRVRKMQRLVDHALCKLPFEEEWLRQRGCNARYVGHPYFDQLDTMQLDQAFLAEQTDPSCPLVTILPGSRTQEIVQNLETLLQAAARVRSQVPSVRFAIAAYDRRKADAVAAAVQQSGLDVEIHVGRTQELIHLATCCMACSGSVSLELLYHEKPTVILYKISSLAYQVQKIFRKVRYITLVNLLAAEDPFDANFSAFDSQSAASAGAEALFPEYLTWRDVSGPIAGHIVEWLTNGDALAARRQALAEIKRSVAQPGASRRAADYILGELSRPSPPIPRPHFLPSAADGAGQGTLSDSGRRGRVDTARG